VLRYFATLFAVGLIQIFVEVFGHRRCLSRTELRKFNAIQERCISREILRQKRRSRALQVRKPTARQPSDLASQTARGIISCKEAM
jgi:hypothetical protein